MVNLIKNFIKVEENLDFNFISKLLDRNNLYSIVSSNCMDVFVLESVFQIKNIEKDLFFFDLIKKLNELYNKNNFKSESFLFFSLVSGNKSITHRDQVNVYILNLFGKTLYYIEDKEYILEKGDLLFIPKNSLHKAIGLTPRICLSFTVYS